LCGEEGTSLVAENSLVYKIGVLLQEFSDVFPHLVTATNVPTLTKISDVDWSEIDAAFCCLPHATTQEILNSLPRHIKVVDLSADFRLKDIKVYAEW